MEPSKKGVQQGRVVIFMTSHRPADIPGIDNPLACLLPFGSATFAEKIMETCALAGVREIDVVVSDQPESVRAVLADGSAWGLRINWHLARDTVSPYQTLRGLNFADDDLVVIGHAHQWVCERVLRALLQRPSAAMHIGQAVFWSGWYSDTARRVCLVEAYEDYASMTRLVLSLTVPAVLVQADEFVSVSSAAELLDAQGYDLGHAAHSAPASWSRMPWGAMSPDATVSPSATMVGPVLIGPGCVVDSSAQIGPNVVLTRDVFVSGGAEIRQSLVLPNTYVDGRVTLDQVIVQGNTVQNLKWDVRTVMVKDDAMLTPLFSTRDNRTPVTSKIIGALLAVLLLPLLVVFAGLQGLLQKPMLWQSAQVVRSRNLENGAPKMVTVRQASAPGWLAAAISFYGAVLDIVQGRRRWFGLRPRNTSEWLALSPDWQNLFSHAMIGVFHAPSWSEDTGTQQSESLAVADAFMVANSTFAYRFGLIAKWTFVTRLDQLDR
jgi:hypothetical protein